MGGDLTIDLVGDCVEDGEGEGDKACLACCCRCFLSVGAASQRWLEDLVRLTSDNPRAGDPTTALFD